MAEIEITQKEQKKLLLNNLISSPFFTIIASVLATFIVAALFFKFSGPVPISVTQTTLEKQNSFDTTGKGSYEVVPDEATMSFGITTQGSTVISAQNNANAVINNVKDALVESGVEKDDIKTSNYNINPNYEIRGDRKITGYTVSTNLKVIFRNFETLNQSIDAAVGAGANQVGSLQFQVSEEIRKEAEREARKQAIDKAKSKASEIAKEAGFELGKIINVQENIVGNYPVPFALDSLNVAESAPTEISPGTSDIEISVTISYETR